MLFGLNKWEAEMCCRVIISILMGSIIGFERRRADRPACSCKTAELAACLR